MFDLGHGDEGLEVGASFGSCFGLENIPLVRTPVSLRVSGYRFSFICLITAAYSLPSGGIGTFGPLIIKGFGFNQVKFTSFSLRPTVSYPTIVPNSALQHPVFCPASYPHNIFGLDRDQTEAQVAGCASPMSPTDSRFCSSSGTRTRPRTEE